MSNKTIKNYVDNVKNAKVILEKCGNLLLGCAGEVFTDYDTIAYISTFSVLLLSIFERAGFKNELKEYYDLYSEYIDKLNKIIDRMEKRNKEVREIINDYMTECGKYMDAIYFDKDYNEDDIRCSVIEGYLDYLDARYDIRDIYDELFITD